MDTLRKVRISLDNGVKLHLETWDTGRTDWRGQSYIGYRLRYVSRVPSQRLVIFEGENFSGSPFYADDSNETLGGLLTFLSLRPGDTDREYFDSYTPDQMDFAQTHGEYLSLVAMRMGGTL